MNPSKVTVARRRRTKDLDGKSARRACREAHRRGCPRDNASLDVIAVQMKRESLVTGPAQRDDIALLDADHPLLEREASSADGQVDDRRLGHRRLHHEHGHHREHPRGG
jgi:hypothetical protein